MGRPAKYPWDVWLNGQRQTLQPGVDYDPKLITPELLRNQILTRARRVEHLEIRTEIKKGWILIEPKTLEIDWDKEFAKDVAAFEKGIDFTTDIDRFVGTVRSAANRRGLRCKIQTTGQVVTVMTVKPPSPTFTAVARAAAGDDPTIRVRHNIDVDATRA